MTSKTTPLKRQVSLLALLLLTGTAVGYVLPSSGTRQTDSGGNRRQPETIETGSSTKQSLEREHRFKLSRADMRDSLEAPTLAIGEEERIFLAWASQTSDSERTLFLTSSADDGGMFSPPWAAARSEISIAVSQRGGKTIARPLRMLPHLAADDPLYLAWCAAAADNTTVQMVLARSSDGGQTFTPAQPVHRSLQARPTFTALAAGPGGQLACSWLDHRHGVQQPCASVRNLNDETFGEESLIFAGQNAKGVCPCCPTSVALAADGTVLVAFRNQMDGYRDIALALRRPGERGFSEPISVVPPTWKFDGCPHDGPSLAVADDGTVHVAWMDAHSGRPQVYHGQTSLDKLKFKVQPIYPSSAGSQGNAKLCFDSSRRLCAVWEESLSTDETVADQGKASGTEHRHGPPNSGSGRAIMLSRLQSDGTFAPAQAVAPRPGKFQSRPAVACTASGVLVVAWNELDESGKRIVVKTILPEPTTVARRNLP